MPENDQSDDAPDPIIEDLLLATFRELKVEPDLANDVRRYIAGDRTVMDQPVVRNPLTGLQIPGDFSRAAKIAFIARHYFSKRYAKP